MKSSFIENINGKNIIIVEGILKRNQLNVHHHNIIVNPTTIINEYQEKYSRNTHSVDFSFFTFSCLSSDKFISL